MIGGNHNNQRNNVFRNAVGAKGVFKVFERVYLISSRYGLSPQKIDHALNKFLDTLSRYDTKATFPTPALVVKRYPQVIKEYQAKGIEFAVHGLKHIDYSQLSYEEQMKDLVEAKSIFTRAGIEFHGFRTPYLRRAITLDQAIRDVGLSYSSNQPIIWDAVKLESLDDTQRASYTKGLDFYEAWSANERVSLPSIKDGVIHIPVSLPDDEMLLDRIRNKDQGLITRAWGQILEETYQRGEMFTLQLHPERIALCAESLSSILADARRRAPKIWIATLQEVNEWWRKRIEIKLELSEGSDGIFHVFVNSEEDLSILLKNVNSSDIGEPFYNGYILVKGKELSFPAPNFPGIGLDECLFEKWSQYLRQQGFLVEQARQGKQYACSISGADGKSLNEVEIVKHIESTNQPLIRLNLWPQQARSALCITGDLDALTLWDFGQRVLGN